MKNLISLAITILIGGAFTVAKAQDTIEVKFYNGLA